MFALNDFFSMLLQILGILNYLVAVIVVVYERKNPAVTWAWLMVLLLVPYVGFIIYLLLGMDGRKHRVFISKAREDDEIYARCMELDSEANAFMDRQFGYLNQKNVLRIPGSEHLNDLVYLNLMSGNAAFTTNNHVTAFFNGNDKFESLLADIEGATHFIHMQYYIVRYDSLSKRIIDALAQKAAAGVEVRFLIDGMGCLGTSHKLYEPLIRAGGFLGEFLPPHFIRINYRNHRKLAVIDGHTGYIGGLNIGNEYLGLSKKFGYWRDCHIRISGEAVRQLGLRFLMDWNFCAQDKMPLHMRYFPAIRKPDTGGVPIQVVSSGPDTRWPNIQYSYAKMINEADKSIFIQTPYFVPNDSIFEALRIAALSGIDVRVVIPAHPDHPFVYWASLSYLGELLQVGVKCYKYEKGFVHSKLLLIDGLITSVGTANMDPRSFMLNFEVNAFIFDQKIAAAFEKQYILDLEDCTRIEEDWYASRSNLTKVRESVSRLLSPLL